MALIDSKQLNPRFTGSFILSGSTQTFIGRSDFQGSITASADISASGTIFADKFQSAGSNNEISFDDDLFVTGNISGSVTSTGSFGKIVIDDDIDLVEDQRIHFEADRGTYIESHASDTFRVVVNDRQMYLLDEDTCNRVVFGNGTKVFIGANNNKIPTASLHIGGDIFLSGSNGNVTASGNFSGSFTSTGSFGLIQAD